MTPIIAHAMPATTVDVQLNAQDDNSGMGTQPGCGATLHRDANGAANMCSRACAGRYGVVQAEQATHRRAIVVSAATPANVAHASAPSARS